VKRKSGRIRPREVLGDHGRQTHLGVVWKPESGQEAFLPELSSPFSDLNCEGSTRRGQSGLQLRIATTEGALLFMPTKS